MSSDRQPEPKTEHIRTRIIGDGTPEDPYRADVPDGVDARAEIPCDRDGRPTAATCAASVSAAGKARFDKQNGQRKARRT